MGERGGISTSQIVMLAGVVAVAYLGYLYLPIFSHRMDMSQLAREISHKALLNGNDQDLMAQLTQDPRAQSLNVGLSDIRIDRPSDGSKTCSIHWREQPHPFWNKNQVIEMRVSEKAEFGSIGVQNAQ